MQSEPEFTVEPESAEEVLLDRRYFKLSADAFKRFTDMIDNPQADNPKLRRLLHTKAPWEKRHAIPIEKNWVD